MNGIWPAAAVGEDTETVGSAMEETGTEQEEEGTLGLLSSTRSSPVSSLKLTLLQ